MKSTSAKIALFSTSALGLLLLAGQVAAYRGGTSGGYSGAPGERDCTSCHRSFPLNSGSATFEVSASETLVGQANLPVQVAFTGSTFNRWGFELSMRDSSGATSGAWTITDPTNTQLSSGTHVSQTRNGSGQSSWSATWTPPGNLPAGPLTFYSAGLEADGSGTSNDPVYTSAFTVYQAEVSTANATWPLGSTQMLNLAAPTRPGSFYVLAISDSTTPTPLGGAMDLPVNLASPFFSLVLQGFPIFQNFIGALDAAGNAQATVLIPNIPFLSGFQWHFAFATLTPAANVTEVSNRTSVVLQ